MDVEFIYLLHILIPTFSNLLSPRSQLAQVLCHPFDWENMSIWSWPCSWCLCLPLSHLNVVSQDLPAHTSLKTFLTTVLALEPRFPKCHFVWMENTNFLCRQGIVWPGPFPDFMLFILDGREMLLTFFWLPKETLHSFLIHPVEGELTCSKATMVCLREFGAINLKTYPLRFLEIIWTF